MSAVHAHGARGQEHLRLSSAAPPPCLLLQEILSFTVMMGGSPVCRCDPAHELLKGSTFDPMGDLIGLQVLAPPPGGADFELDLCCGSDPLQTSRPY